MAIIKSELKEQIDSICTEKGLELEEVIDAIELSIASAYRRELGKRENSYEVNFDVNQNRYSLYQTIAIVDEVKNPYQEISLLEARLSNPNARLDDIIKTEIAIDQSIEFGRIASLVAKQVLTQTINNTRHTKLLQEFKEKIGDLVNVEIDYFNKGGYQVKLGQTFGFLSKDNILPIDKLRSGNVVKALIVDIVEDAKGGSRALLSRTHPDFIRALLKQEIPEIEAGIVQINKIVREAGSRTKILVSASENENIDPVGSILGRRNMRIINILRNITPTMQEKIDIIENQPNRLDVMIMDSLEPAEIDEVQISLDGASARVYLKNEEAALAVGRRGINIKLAQELLGMKLEIVTTDDTPENKRPSSNDKPSIVLE